MKQKKGISRLIQLSGEKKTVFYLGSLFSVLGTIMQLTPFLSINQVMAELLRHGAADKPLDAALMIHWAFYGLAGLLAGYLFSYVGGMLSHIFAYRTIYSIRLKAAEHIGRLPMGYVSNHAVGKIKQVLDADVEQMEAFLAHQFPDFLSTLVLLAVILMVMAVSNIWMALACLLPIAIGFGCQFATMMKLMKSGAIKENFDALENISSSSAQYIKGMPSIKIFGQTVRSFRKFYDDIIRYRDFTIQMTELVRPGYVRFRVFVLSTATFIVPVGLLLYMRSPENAAFAATFIFFLILGPAAASPTLKLRSFSERMNTIAEGVRRVDMILNEEPLREPEQGKVPDTHNVVFENVSFSYDGDGCRILNGVSFQAKQGEITALAGPSGAGKSTIAQLIPRFWDVTAGVIKIGGIDIREIKTQDLMKQMSFVFQESFLFDDTVYNNIALGRPEAGRQEVEEAAKAAQCHDFILALPKGYDTKIGAGGVRLSGGEQQRIAIARAILKNAPILILDEATTAADAENEYKMQMAIQELIKNKTVIMIAHRLRTISHADQILVISGGTVWEKGAHEELLRKQGLYASMWETSISPAAWRLSNGKEAAAQ